MTGGTLLVSRWEKLFSHWKQRLDALGFRNVFITSEAKDSLNMLINELKPRLVLMGSSFYHAGTPYMAGQLLRNFPKLNIAVINMLGFSDNMAPFFIWQGVKSYINYAEGFDEFHLGLQKVRKGEGYISPNIKHIVENNEWPDLKTKMQKRQLEVLVMLCNGIIPEDIGNQLHVSKRTVDWHIEELFKVFCVSKREELISMAFYLDLVTKDDLCFFDRKIKKIDLPQWAVLKSASMPSKARRSEK